MPENAQETSLKCVHINSILTMPLTVNYCILF